MQTRLILNDYSKKDLIINHLGKRSATISRKYFDLKNVINLA